MRLAVFCPYLPAPADSGGRIRITRLLSRVAEAHELCLFAKANRGEALAAEACPELEMFAERTVAGGQLELSARLREPERVISGTPQRLGDAVLAAHARHPFDGAIVEHAHAGRFVRLLRVPFVLDEHNIESQFLAAKLRARGTPRLYARHEVARLARFEGALWQAARRVVSVSEDEARVIEARCRVHPRVIPNGVSFDGFDACTGRQAATIVFVGLMDHPPNVTAALELAHEILPRVRARVPNARLVLCGKNPSPQVRGLASSHVEVTGSVASVAPYWSQATVFTNALRDGAGTSLKVLEALAAGTPMVSTAEGVRGFADLNAGEHYLAADTHAELAERTADVIERPGDFQDMIAAGKAYARQLDWGRLAEQYLEVVEEGLARSHHHGA
ncbi:MAG: glycosyltransferase family 4 protein [Myxococcales bacterium]|nr:glycosyltransferase family 4 protein [Myxococcales bacterium]